MSDARSLLIFGYGSLVWRPDFPFSERLVGWIEGFSRRFYQGSPDHRGVPERPGRVVTLIHEPGARCGGVAYRVAREVALDVLELLDYREKGGYERCFVPFYPLTGPSEEVLVYLASSENPHYLGPAPFDEMVRQILASHGPSGPNTEYLLRLDDALMELGLPDDHVHELALATRLALKKVEA